MAKTKVIFIPWYVNEWLASTYMMRPVEYTFYHRALMQYYLKGKPLSQIDIDRLIASTSSDTSSDTSDDTSDDRREMCRAIIEEHFVRSSDGLYHNVKADEELAKIGAKSQKARDAVAVRLEKQRKKNERSSSDTSDETSSDRSNDHLINNQYPLTNSNSDTSLSREVSVGPANQQASSDSVEGAPWDEAEKPQTKAKNKPVLFSETGITTLPDEWRSYASTYSKEIDADQLFADFIFYWTQGEGKDIRRAPKGWATTWQHRVRFTAEQLSKRSPSQRKGNSQQPQSLAMRGYVNYDEIDYHEGINPDGTF